jgi:hypothetical protein
MAHVRGDHRFWHEVEVVVFVVLRVVLVMVVLLILWIKRDDFGGLAGIFDFLFEVFFVVMICERYCGF